VTSHRFRPLRQFGTGVAFAGARRRATTANQTAPIEPKSTPRSSRVGPGQTRNAQGPGVHIPPTHEELHVECPSEKARINSAKPTPRSTAPGRNLRPRLTISGSFSQLKSVMDPLGNRFSAAIAERCTRRVGGPASGAELSSLAEDRRRSESRGRWLGSENKRQNEENETKHKQDYSETESNWVCGAEQIRGTVRNCICNGEKGPKAKQNQNDSPNEKPGSHLHACGPTGEIDVLYRLSPPDRLEVTVPDRVRWWTERSNAFVEEREKAGAWSESTVVAYRGILRVVQRHLTLPGGLPPTPPEIGPAHVRRIRESRLAPNTLALNLNVLRGFLRREGNPIAQDEQYWRLMRNDLGKRRWLSRIQAVALWNAATSEERVVVCLELFAGLRRIEVLRLRVRDICFAIDNATANVLGKGYKWRTVSLPPLVWAVLRTQTAEMKPDDQVWPFGETSADRVLYAAGKRSGAFPIRRNGTPDLSHHDLRRTFIRLTLETGKVGIWDVAQMVGHKSADLTIHYAGLDRERATEAARALEASLGLAPGK
jgi:integrase